MSQRALTALEWVTLAWRYGSEIRDRVRRARIAGDDRSARAIAEDLLKADELRRRRIEAERRARERLT